MPRLIPSLLRTLNVNDPKSLAYFSNLQAQHLTELIGSQAQQTSAAYLLSLHNLLIKNKGPHLWHTGRNWDVLYIHPFSLDLLFWTFFTDCEMVNHHQTLIWADMFKELFPSIKQCALFPGYPHFGGRVNPHP